MNVAHSAKGSSESNLKDNNGTISHNILTLVHTQLFRHLLLPH